MAAILIRIYELSGLFLFRFYFPESLEDCTFFISDINDEYLWGCLNPRSEWNVPPKYPYSQHIEGLAEILLFEILNVSMQSIGLACVYNILDHQRHILHETGQIIFCLLLQKSHLAKQLKY